MIWVKIWAIFTGHNFINQTDTLSSPVAFEFDILVSNFKTSFSVTFLKTKGSLFGSGSRSSSSIVGGILDAKFGLILQKNSLILVAISTGSVLLSISQIVVEKTANVVYCWCTIKPVPSKYLILETGQWATKPSIVSQIVVAPGRADYTFS